MTQRERMLSVYANKMPDEPVLGIYSRYLPRGKVERLVRESGMGIIDYVPVTTQLAAPWHMYPGYLSEVKGAQLKVEYYWSNGMYRERRTYDTPVGSVYADIGQSVGAGSEHISHHYISSEEDYRVVQYLVENTVFGNNSPMLEQRKKALGEDGVVFGRLDRSPFQKLLIELASSEQFLVDMYTDSEAPVALMEAMRRRMLEQAAIAVASPAEVIWLPENVTSDMTPPDCYSEYSLEYYKTVTAWAKQADKPVAAHMDGRLKALAWQISESGFTAIESFTLPVMNGDMTLDMARTAFRDMAVVPNFPSILSNAPEEDIREWISWLLAESKGIPLMLEVSEDLAEGTWDRVLPIIADEMYRK